MEMVFDASTLILLAKVDLLREVARIGPVIITRMVKEEALVKHGPDAELVRLLINEQRIAVRQVSKRVSQKLRSDFRIHEGEPEALALAIALAAPLAVDDGPTIKACKVLGLPFLTAIHFLVHFAERSIIQQSLALEKLNSLARYGRYKAQIIDNAAGLIKGGR